MGPALLEGAGTEQVEILHQDEVDDLPPTGPPEAALGLEEGAEPGEVGGDRGLGTCGGNSGSDFAEESLNGVEGSYLVESPVGLIESIVFTQTPK